jgi:hypothetical protein
MALAGYAGIDTLRWSYGNRSQPGVRVVLIGDAVVGAAAAADSNRSTPLPHEIHLPAPGKMLRCRICP